MLRIASTQSRGQDRLADESRFRLSSVQPYLVVALAWNALAQLVLFSFLAYSIPSEPLAGWAWSQLLALNHLIWFDVPSEFAAGLVWLAAYLLVGLFAWVVVEGFLDWPSGRIWKRALLAWLSIQAVYSIFAAVLVHLGVLVE